MKALISILTLCLALNVGAQSVTLGSTTSADRADATSNLVDYWQVTKRAGSTIYNVFGYNSGAQQYVQFFDAAGTNGPYIQYSGFSSTAETFTNTVPGELRMWQRIQITNVVAGAAAGIYYAVPITTTTYKIATSLANAQASNTVDLAGSSGLGAMLHLPLNSFVIGATDNFSCIVPDTGIGVGKGFVVANSSTAATYTPGAKDCIFFVTFKGQ